MDIRIARTDRAIEKAFMELRAKNPLEKIKIKDLCALACINKSTFYAHYEDIYALSSGLETKVIGNILACVTDFGPNRPLDHTEELTQGLFRAFVQNQRAVNILFSGSRQGVFANSIEQGLRKRVAELDPTFTADPRRGIVLSFCAPCHNFLYFLKVKFFYNLFPAVVNLLFSRHQNNLIDKWTLLKLLQGIENHWLSPKY